jgi:hypothetical protein
MSIGDFRILTHRKVVYAAAMALAVLFVGEAGLRVRAWIRYGSPATGVRDPILEYDKDADVYIRRAGYEAQGGRIHIKINSLGFRGDEFTVEKPPPTVRIACLGASTTFCAEASWNHRRGPSATKRTARS